MTAGGWIVVGLATGFLVAVTIALLIGLRSTRIRRERASSRIWLARGRVSPLEASECRQHGRRIDRDVPSTAHVEVRDEPPVPDGSGRHRLHDPVEAAALTIRTRRGRP
jgi:hypothetical protein